MGRQRDTIAGYAKILEEKLLDVTQDRSAEDFVHIGDMAAQYFATMMWALSAQFKNPSFRGEREWRLVNLDLRAGGPDQPKTTPPDVGFRAVGNHVVPFWALDYSSCPATDNRLPLVSVTMGSKVEPVSGVESIRYLLDRRSARSGLIASIAHDYRMGEG